MTTLFGRRPRAGDTVDLGPASVRLSVNARARRISVRIAPDGEAIAVAPSARALPRAVEFARSRAGWIAERQAARPAPTRLAPGATVPLRGRPTPLLATPGKSAARLVDGGIVSGGEGEAYARRIVRLLRAESLADLTARTAAHAAALGRPVPAVAVADPRTRWGSCTPASGRIRYSWRLVLAPPEVLDYVAAHEVAHLAEANHSAAFWAVVRRLYGDPAPARAWLAANGAALHAVSSAG